MSENTKNYNDDNKTNNNNNDDNKNPEQIFMGY